jgi:hypothetical protein
MMGRILDWLRLSDCAGEVILLRDRLPFMVMIPLVVLGAGIVLLIASRGVLLPTGDVVSGSG